MTVREAIALADAMAPNAVSQVLKVRWLSELDGRVVQEICSPDTVSDFAGYAENVNQDTVLKIPFPYDGIYPTWLKMHIDRMNGEMQKHNDGVALCDEMLEAYRRTLVRTTSSAPQRVKYF